MQNPLGHESTPGAAQDYLPGCHVRGYPRAAARETLWDQPCAPYLCGVKKASPPSFTPAHFLGQLSRRRMQGLEALAVQGTQRGYTYPSLR